MVKDFMDMIEARNREAKKGIFLRGGQGKKDRRGY
jgi:hypothetical protein